MNVAHFETDAGDQCGRTVGIVPDGKVGYVVEPDAHRIADAIVDYIGNNREEAFTEQTRQEKLEILVGEHDQGPAEPGEIKGKERNNICYISLGLQDFEEIRKRDSSTLTRRMSSTSCAQTGKYYFLGRPRRFSKTLLLSTLDKYLSGRRELFDGLKIASLERTGPSTHTAHQPQQR